MYVSSTGYRPRYAALTDLEHDVMVGKTRSLQGGLVSYQKDHIVIGRELRAVLGLRSSPDFMWDGRWCLMAPEKWGPKDLEVRALGEGLSQCSDWRDMGLGRKCLQTTPALWHNDELIAAPMAQKNHENLIKTAPSGKDFLSFILSH
jgi:tRNA(Ile)-lysidine synthase